MAKFTYRFQSILRLKIQLEDQKKNEFGSLQRKIIEERQKLVDLENEINDLMQNLQDILVGVVHIKTVHYYQNAIALKMYYSDVQEVLLKDLHKKEHQKRQELVQAMTQRRLYEKIRENRLEVWKKESNSKEQKFLDFLSLNLNSAGQP